MARQPKQVFETILVAYDGSPQSLENSGRQDRSSRIRASLQESSGSLLKRELQLYGLALSLWSEQIVRKLETLVNSYADAYRVQIHRISGTSDAVINIGQLQSDLDLLKNWNAPSTTEFAANRA